MPRGPLSEGPERSDRKEREASSHGEFGVSRSFLLDGHQPMTGEDSQVDQIVEELLSRGGTKKERMKLLRELVRRGEDLPEEMLNSALKKLMERLAQ